MPGSVFEKPQTISISTSTLMRTVLVLLACAFLWFIRDLVAILFVSILLAAIIDPFADWVARRKLPRGLAVVILYVVIAGLLALSILLLVPAVSSELSQLTATIPNSPVIGYVNHIQQFTTQYGLSENLRAALQSLQNGIANSFSSIFSTITGFLDAIATLFIILVLTFYMVVEDEAARRSFRSLAPEEYRPYLSGLFLRMQKKVGGWLRGQLLLGLVIGVAAYIGLSILGVHYALVLALVAGLFELIPYVGPVMSAIPAAFIALGQSPLIALAVLVLYFLIQQLENHFLVPKIMQKTTGLNPIVSIVALLIGVKIAGVAGAFLSVPVATMLSVILEDLLRHPEPTL